MLKKSLFQMYFVDVVLNCLKLNVNDKIFFLIQVLDRYTVFIHYGQVFKKKYIIRNYYVPIHPIKEPIYRNATEIILFYYKKNF